MTKVHFFDDVFEVDVETALQVERWLDKQGYLEKIKQKGYYFQGISFNDNPQGLEDILKYKTNVKDREVWSLIFDLNYDDETLEQQDETWRGGARDSYSSTTSYPASRRSNVGRLILALPSHLQLSTYKEII